MSAKKILDVTCGSRSIWFNKNHPNAIYCDKRREYDTKIWKSGDGLSERTLTVDPDVQCDFTDLPFEDNSFSLVVFDPPHLTNVSDTAWLAKKYGRLGERWPQMLYGACARVAKAMGYKRIITYILESENGASLKASGFSFDGIAGGLKWTGKRDKGQDIPFEMKKRFVKEL